MRVARIEDRQRPQWYRTEVLEIVAREHGILRGVGHREGQVRGALLQELEVVDRCGGDLRRCFGVRQAFGDYLRDAAAVRIEDAASAAGRNRQTTLAAAVGPGGA